jgi:hypothetical protein
MCHVLLHLQPIVGGSTPSNSTSKCSLDTPPPTCHPERSRGTSIAPFPNANAKKWHRPRPGSVTPQISCAAGNRPAVLPATRKSFRTRHPQLVIPSEAEGPAVRLSRTQLQKVSRRPRPMKNAVTPISQSGDRRQPQPSYFCACSKRLLTSSQFTVPHHAAR